MARFESKIYRSEFFILPTIGIVKMKYGIYDYKYRLAFAWFNFRASVGFVKESRYPERIS
jgi:hypothetical protein